ncbi:MAG TPA: PAS domain-containing sensor histidine kinase [Steroidobacteraceae bacterium]|nr:PAS domain-containing sensor histidine kinase [Steroidobacteraceae bacterium]
MKSAASSRLNRLLPAAASWLLLLYALLLCAAVWGYATLRIESDHRNTLEKEREHLRSVAGTLRAQIEAMIGDGVGGAVAGANELGAEAGIDKLPVDRLSTTLQHMLTGRPYVRALFLASPQRFVLMPRSGATDVSSQPPSWLAPVFTQKGRDTWVGPPFIMNADGSREHVVPVAQRVGHGAARDTWAGALFTFSSSLATPYTQPDTESGVGVYVTDGTALALITQRALRNVAPLEEGHSVAASSLYRRVGSSGSGVVEGANPYTGKPTIAAYDHVPGYPIIVAAARSRSAALAEWHARRRDTLVLASGLTLLVGVMTALLDYLVRSMRRRELHYRTLFNNVAFAAFILEDDRLIEANRTSASMFGVDHPDRLIGLSPWELSPPLQPDGTPSDASDVRTRVRQALRHGATSFEWLHQRLDNRQPFYANVDLSTLDSAGKRLTLAVVHDITQRRLTEQERERVVSELRELAGALVHIQDDERRRIGRDLHDATGQVLASLELKLERLARVAGPLAPSSRALLEECLTLAHQCAAEIRTASYLLHPPLLDEIGLVSALRWLADGLRQRSDLEIHLALPQTMDRMPREHELALFRVAQEALTNVQRHSKSPSVAIRLFEHDGSVVLEIEDSGRGIAGAAGAETIAAAFVVGVGLAGMRERMRQLGGTLRIRSNLNGTCVRAELPLARSEHAARSVSA